MAVIGGLESLLAAAIGAIFLHFSLEFLQQIPIPNFAIPFLLQYAETLEGVGFGLDLDSNRIFLNAWRLAGFGLLLMLTLRFWRNGLISPLIARVTRKNLLAETVAKRLRPGGGEATS
jgi:branched-chain amino acid transport system permease protein